VVDRGGIVERGTHDELLALGGRYARLVARDADLGPTVRLAARPRPPLDVVADQG
jgi:hypothetical protein